MTAPKRPIGRPRSDDPSKVYAVRLRKSQIAQLQDVARSQGIGASTLVREWVDQHLSQDQPGQEPV